MVVFSVCTFWVQVHGLPSLWLSKANLRKIGSMIGSIIEVNFTRDGGGVWKKFIRIRVDKPIFLPRTNNDDLWVCLRYEKLSKICFHCGVIDHSEKFCKSELFQLCNHASIMFNTARPWLRAESNEIPLGLLHPHPLSQSPTLASVVEQGLCHCPSLVEPSQLDKVHLAPHAPIRVILTPPSYSLPNP